MKCAAFDVCFRSVGELDQPRAFNFYLEPDEQSAKRLKTMRESIFAAFPSPPDGSWSVDGEGDDEVQRHGKRKVKGKGKGKGKGTVFWQCPDPKCMNSNSALEDV